VRGVLNFKLEMTQLLDDEIGTFEATLSDFLQARVSWDGIEFSEFNATIISQTLVVNADPITSKNRTEPVRTRSLEETSLVIAASVSAIASSSSSSSFPFQNMIHRVLSENSNMFYDTLFSSDAFSDLGSQEGLPRYVDVDLEGGGNNRSLALGSSIAGIIIFLSLAVAFFVIRRNNARQAEEEDCDAPVCDVGQLDEGGCDMSSLDDSLLVDKYPNNVPHFPNDSLPSTSNDDAAKSSAKSDQQSYDWSLDDAFPLKRNEDKAKNVHVMPRPGDSLTSTCNDGGVTLEDVFPLKRNEDTMMPPQMSDESTASPSIKADLKQDAFIPYHDDEQSMQSEEADGLKRLYEKAMVDESMGGVDTKEDSELVNNCIEEEVQDPTPTSARGLKMFSCFADNTFDEQTLTTKRLLGKNYRSNATPKTSNTTRLKIRGNEYEVRAPPGPLGILIDSSKDGPIVHEVKEGSPLLNLVESGDVILTVDGVDCRNKDAVSLANWISTKPRKREQVLTLMGDLKYDDTTAQNDDGEMSV